MLYTSLFSTLFAAVALAAPAPSPAASKSMMAAGEWTIESLKRTCNADDTACDWEFGINTNTPGVAVQACKITAKGKPASQTDIKEPQWCGPYRITTGWSDQFGKDEGFTTLAVVDEGKRQIVYPAYQDKQLKNGVPVVPDQKYTPAALP
ncbi:small secreted protein [Apiospora marii]|uniref:Small secreted protein n=1 Tax=Apiospora marii TaxID=335849 RepID=A0ABR1S7R1_9PEZI